MSMPRTRREPPPFRRVEVSRLQALSPSLLRVTLAGPALQGLGLGLPAASVRLLLPSVESSRGGAAEVVVPDWNGNEFLFQDGTRPVIRTLTPLRLDSAAHELDVEIVLHGQGPLSEWAAAARPGDQAAISGTGRGYDVDQAARSFLVAGDESALPAISVLLAALPQAAAVQVLVELSDLAARIELPGHAGASVQWCELAIGARPGDALVAAVTGATLDPDVRVWAAGEAAAVQRIRRHLFDACGLPRSHAVVRGYWKHGRASEASDE